MTRVIEQTYIIAEIGSVHDGSFGNACKLIDMAGNCGANAVKFQTHIAEAETLRDAPMPAYFQGEERFQYFQRTSFDAKQWSSLKKRCHDNQLDFISSPFSVEAVKLLHEVGVDKYKIPSGEITNTLLLDAVGETGRPVIISSGMSTWAELDEAVRLLKKHDNPLAILQCTSEYPCPYEKVGLHLMQEFKDRYALPVGLSDHTITPYASLAAVTLGATIIERHVTFSRLMYGSDAKHSLEPTEFQELVCGIRAIETMLESTVDKDSVAAELAGMKKIFEKSVVAAKDIAEGTIITPEMLTVKKPGSGLPPSRLASLIGMRARVEIKADTIVQDDYFA